ncbi:MAG TPA: S53 family peptidase [Ktedonobacterales bacterium]
MPISKKADAWRRMTFWEKSFLKARRFAALGPLPGFLAAMLLLTSCALSTPVVNDPSASTPGSQAPGTTTSPYKPGAQAAQILSECSATAAPGGCLSPEQVQTFYNLNSLYNKGYTGRGQTIVIIDSFGSPTIQRDLKVFDQTFGLPDPPSFKVLAPLGAINFNDPQASGWAGEATLDVEWAHAIAPGASIVLLESPVAETEGVQGFPQFEQLSTYALDNHLGQIISQSYGASEPTLVGDVCNENLGSGESLLQNYDQTVYQRAEQAKVTVLASSGDAGATNEDCTSSSNYSYRNAGWPASDPLVTAVGGTKLTLKNNAGVYGSEKVWNEDGGASGGGTSQFYAEPDWQKNLPNQSLLKGKRGLPDVSWGAAVNFALYSSFDSANTGWSAIGGTSASAPQWAGLVAIANQMAGKPLGFLNPALYKLAGKGFHDITSGDNSLDNVDGFQASQGWDMATGWGTPDAAVLLPQLIQAVQNTKA